MCGDTVPYGSQPLQPQTIPCGTTTLQDLATLQACLAEVRAHCRQQRAQMAETEARLTSAEASMADMQRLLAYLLSDRSALEEEGRWWAVVAGEQRGLAEGAEQEVEALRRALGEAERERDAALDAATLAGVSLTIVEDELAELRKRLGEKGL